MGRRSTGAVERYHALCLCQGLKPLGAPLTLIVGGLVANFDSHGSFALVDVVSLDGHGAVALKECTVHPLTHAALTVDHQAYHVTTAAGVTADAATVPLYDGGTGEGRQDDPLTGSARTLHVDEHGQVVDGVVDHRCVV